MNKYLNLTAVALTAMVGGNSTSIAAKSGSAVIIEHSDGGSSYCDQIDLTWNGTHFADIHDYTPCALDSLPKGMGIATRTKGIGRNVTLSEYYIGDVESGYYVDFQIGLPLKNYNAFNAYYTTNGVDVTLFFKGWYRLATPGEKPNGPSVIDVLRAYIKKHK